ncbi:MAG: isoprenyl transferase [Lachnospiraceae bacterium]|nr:isoprenyl transferase [Lachnospiraceae bacterium]
MAGSIDVNSIKEDLKGCMPNHIAIIMDGNGRWASKRFLPKNAGHKAGANTLEKIVRFSDSIGLKHLTAYAFSTENWKRSEEEVKGIMDLLREYLDRFRNRIDLENVRIDVIGDVSRLDDDIKDQIAVLERDTKNNSGTNFHIALNYGGRDEILRAVRAIANDVKSDKIKIGDINEDVFSGYLDTKAFADPDLLIRTSGELRISNFLLWQLAYTEMFFSDKLWPDFSESDLIDAIYSYCKRDRRFGGRK